MSSLTSYDKNKLNKILKGNSFEYTQENIKKEYEKRMNIIKSADEAFLNSILSCAVYAQNSWMFTKLNSELSDMGEIFNDAIKNKDKMYDLKIWHFMKNTFKKIGGNELKLPSEGFFYTTYGYKVNFSLEDGQYSTADGLAHANILKSKDPKGKGNTLHLAFRGTEFSKLLKYVKGPYLDMSAYYENFMPFIESIRKYVNNPENNITELHVNGHSLGGAMVQEFLKNNPPESFSIPIKGFTFGSPGSEKKWYHKFSTLAYHTLLRGVPLNFVLNDGITNDERMTQYYHNNDPIPLVGLLGYMKGGNNYALPDVSYKNDKEAQLEKQSFLEKNPVFGKLITGFKENILNKFNTKFHDSKRYIINLRNYIENQEFSSNSTFINKDNLTSWRKHEKDFSTLSIKYKSAFEYLIKKQNPELDNDKVAKQLLEIRARMRYDSQSSLILSKFRNIDKNHGQRDSISDIIENLYFENGNLKNKHFEINYAEEITEKNKRKSQITPDIDESVERIKRMRKLYEEKMEARAAIFKKA
jgi:hypothetical protein